jgi:hypothetical protein
MGTFGKNSSAKPAGFDAALIVMRGKELRNHGLILFLIVS